MILQKIKNISGKIIKFLDDYKVIVVSVLAILLLVFLNKNSVVNLVKLENDVRTLQEQKKTLQQTIAEDSIFLNRLNSDNEAFERYLREKYYFHKPNEDVYIIIQR